MFCSVYFKGLIALLLFVCGAVAVDAQPAAERPLHMALRVDMPPFVAKGGKAGIEVDILKLVATEAGLQFDFTQFPIQRLVPAFEQNRVDGVTIQKDNAPLAGCKSDVYFEHENVAMTLASAGLEIDAVADLSNYSVMSFETARINLQPAFAEAVDKSPQYSEVFLQRHHIELLYQERFQVVVGDRWILRLSQREAYETNRLYRELRVHSILPPLRFVVFFHAQAPCRAFNAGLAKVRADGRYDALLATHHQRLSSFLKGLR